MQSKQLVVMVQCWISAQECYVLCSYVGTLINMWWEKQVRFGRTWTLNISSFDQTFFWTLAFMLFRYLLLFFSNATHWWILESFTCWIAGTIVTLTIQSLNSYTVFSFFFLFTSRQKDAQQYFSKTYWSLKFYRLSILWLRHFETLLSAHQSSGSFANCDTMASALWRCPVLRCLLLLFLCFHCTQGKFSESGINAIPGNHNVLVFNTLWMCGIH